MHSADHCRIALHCTVMWYERRQSSVVLRTCHDRRWLSQRVTSSLLLPPPLFFPQLDCPWRDFRLIGRGGGTIFSLPYWSLRELGAGWLRRPGGSSVKSRMFSVRFIVPLPPGAIIVGSFPSISEEYRGTQATHPTATLALLSHFPAAPPPFVAFSLSK